MSFIQKLYNNSPAQLQNLFCSIQGYLINKARYNQRFEELFSLAKKRLEWNEEEIIRYRNLKLKNFLISAYEGTTYYKQLFDNINYDPYSDFNYEEFCKIPILTKSDVQQFRNEIKNEKSNHDLVTMHTSGTTGAGLIFPKTKDSINEQWAIWWRYREKHGINRQMWCGYFGGRSVVPSHSDRPPFYRINYPGKQIMFSAYHISERNIDNYIDALIKYKIKWIHGYPSIISLIARCIIDKNLKSTDLNVSYITTGAENLLVSQKEIIKAAFGVYPIEHYGLAEGAANFSELPNGKILVDEDFSFVEFVSSNLDDSFRVVGTAFNNPAFPLIRYDAGDLAYTENGNNLNIIRTVKSIDGRSEDFVVLKNGSKIGRTDHIFKDMINIVEAQIYQPKIGEIYFRIVKGENYSTFDHDTLINEIHERLGKDERIIIEYVNAIEKTKSGKLRLVVSDIAKLV